MVVVMERNGHGTSNYRQRHSNTTKPTTTTSSSSGSSGGPTTTAYRTERRRPGCTRMHRHEGIHNRRELQRPSAGFFVLLLLLFGW